MQRLGKNLNSYVGETIDVQAVLADCLSAARTHGWSIEEILPAPRQIFGFVRKSVPHSKATRKVYISTGIHGDEPAGPLAARQLVQENAWAADLDLWICPCLNPTGFPLNRRENSEGVDLNREYLNPKAAEVVAHVDWLQRQPNFDISFCLHEDWESQGFYVYELNPNNLPSLAERMISRIAEVCPVDQSDIIEGRQAKGGIIRPDFDPRSRPQWPEAFHLITYKSPRSYTLEAPSDFPLSARVAALVTGVRAALDEFARS